MKYLTLVAYLKVQDALNALAAMHSVENDVNIRKAISDMLDNAGITDSQLEYVEYLVNAIIDALPRQLSFG